jgi:predicted Zn-dependent protease with MMP-like domain
MGGYLTPEMFDELVDEALAAIPSELLERVDNCVVVVEERPGPSEGDVLGYYDGIPLSERDSGYFGVLPDRIVLFREPIIEQGRTRAGIIREIRVTVWHEVAHYFGIDDAHLGEWGYA